MAALGDGDKIVRTAAAQALEKFGARAPAEPLKLAVGDSAETMRVAAIQALKRSHPDALYLIEPEATAILRKRGPGTVLGSLTHGLIAEIIGNMGRASPDLVGKLTELLDWPYWEVRMKAAQALGKLYRNIPDVALRRLFELRHDPQSQTVRETAEIALAAILSLETGIEDD